MLEKLTEEQEALLIQTRDEWINRFFETKEINKKEFEVGIKWLYEALLKRKPPKVIYCDSWLSCLLTIGILKSDKFNLTVHSVRDSVGDSVRDSVGDSVRASVGDSVWGSVRD